MKSDMELIESVKTAAIGSIGDELIFAFPEVLDVIKQCSINEIAVLGVEIHKALGGQYQTQHLSTYGLSVPRSGVRKEKWVDYVQMNNTLAEEFVRQHPTGDEHVYVLTTSSWREFCETQQM